MKLAPIKVELIDHMGDDITVVNAARVSFEKESDWVRGPVTITPDPQDPEATVWHIPETLKDSDAKLINYLATHNHWSPFAHTSIQLRVKAPLFVARQLVKHQVGGVWNEVSRRYVDSEPEFFLPEFFRGRPVGSIKQGSAGLVEKVHGVSTAGVVRRATSTCLHTYNDLLAAGVAPEQARMVLPLNTHTEWIWTGSLMFFARVYRERMAPGAQLECRAVASAIGECVQPLFPVSWAALTDSITKEES